MDYWFCVSVCLHVSVFSRERYNVQMLRASLSETPGLSVANLPLGVRHLAPPRCKLANCLIFLIVIFHWFKYKKNPKNCDQL